MATTSHRQVATRTITIGLLLVTISAAIWLAFVGADQQRTIVRLTQPVATGEYITSADIEAVRINVGSSDASNYVTTGQAAAGLVAARDLAVGDVLLVSSVYATTEQTAPDNPIGPMTRSSSTLGLLAIAAGGLGVLAFSLAVVRRRAGVRSEHAAPALAPHDRPPGWLHVEVNTWIAEDGHWTQRAITKPQGALPGAWAPPSPRQRVESGEATDTVDDDAVVAPVLVIPQVEAFGAPPTEVPIDQADAIEDASHVAFRPNGPDVDSSRGEPAVAVEAPPSASGLPAVLLQVFGDVKVHGVSVSQAAATPFILAAAGRPMSTDELVELTGYAAKTFSSVYPASHPIVTRANGMLTLAPGVWTDHGWLAETVRRAADAASAEQNVEAAEWLRQAFELAGRIDGAAYERVPRTRREVLHGRRRDPWAWVDEFPYVVDARTHAGQEAVEATLEAAALWKVLPPVEELPSTGVVDVLCKLAKLLPDVPVARTVRPSRWQTGAPCLLLAALEVADTRDLTGQVHATARRLVADKIIEADLTLADDLDM